MDDILVTLYLTLSWKEALEITIVTITVTLYPGWKGFVVTCRKKPEELADIPSQNITNVWVGSIGNAK